MVRSPSPAALLRCNGLRPEYASTTQEKKGTQTTPFPWALLNAIGGLLNDSDLVKLSHTCKFARKELEGSIAERKKCFEQSQQLTRLPRESRFATLQEIIAHTLPQTSVINNLIAAYGHLPNQHRPQARRAITEWEKLLPESQTGGVCDVGVRLDKVASKLKLVDAFHDGDAETAQMGIAQITNLAPENQLPKFSQKCDDILKLPEEHRLDAFLAIVGNTQNPQILQELADVINELPPADRRAALQAIVDKTQDTQTLEVSVWEIRNLPNADTCGAWHAILNKTQNPQVLEGLVRTFRCLPELDRIDALHTLLDKAQELQILQELLREIPYLPNTDWNVAKQAIDNARNLTIEQLRIQSH